MALYLWFFSRLFSLGFMICNEGSLHISWSQRHWELPVSFCQKAEVTKGIPVTHQCPQALNKTLHQRNESREFFLGNRIQNIWCSQVFLFRHLAVLLEIIRAGLTGSDQIRHFRNMLLLVKWEVETNNPGAPAQHGQSQSPPCVQKRPPEFTQIRVCPQMWKLQAPNEPSGAAVQGRCPQAFPRWPKSLPQQATTDDNSKIIYA